MRLLNHSVDWRKQKRNEKLPIYPFVGENAISVNGRLSSSIFRIMDLPFFFRTRRTDEMPTRCRVLAYERRIHSMPIRFIVNGSVSVKQREREREREKLKIGMRNESPASS